MGRLAELVTGRRMARQQNIPVPSSGSGGWVWNRTLSNERSYLTDVGDGSGNGLVQAGISFITNGFLEAPVRVREKAGEDLKVISDHPMTEFIARPNPFYSGALLWMPTIANWLADGNGYWLITEMTIDGRPISGYFVPSWLIEPKAPADGSVFLDHYEYKPNGRLIKLDPQQIVHYRYGLDPHNPLKGCSPLKYIMREIYSDEEAARFTAALLRNAGAHGLVLSPKGDSSISIEQANESKLDIIQKTTGDHRGEPLVFTSATELQEFGFSPEQMNLASLREIPESRVAAALGIPSAVLGFLSGMKQTAVGATLSELRELAYESGVIPKMRLIAEELNTQLLAHYTDDTSRFVTDFDQSDVRVLQEDADKLHARLRADVQAGVRTVESFKLGVGEKPEPGDNVYLRSFNVQEVGPDAPEQQAPPTPFPAKVAAARMFATSKKATRQQLAYLRQVDREGQKLTPQFAGALRKAFDDLGSRASTAYDEIRPKFVADPVDEQTVLIILAALDVEAWRIITLDPLWRTHYLRAATLTYGAMRANLAIDIGTDLPDPVGRAVVASGGRQLGLIDLTEQTRTALFDALASAREQGLGPVESARRIRQYVSAGRFTGMEAEQPGAGVRYRSELIARTETLHAQRVSVAEAGRAAGFTHYLAFDNRTGFGDEECVAREGETFSYDDMLVATNEEHPNGTLNWAPVPAEQIAAQRGKVTEIQHVEYDDQTGRMVKAWKEEVVG